MTQTLCDTVELVIPCRPEYVGVARLAVLGIASRMPFSYDEVEDVRLAVGEACTHAVERAGDTSAQIKIVSTIDSVALVIEVIDDVPVGTEPVVQSEDAQLLEAAGVDQQGLGALLMEILVDEVKITSSETGTSVRLTKFAPE
ncbi:serine-protein kinase RsbW [Capsulimonas corticalis]|uniref:Serine-protein kinase RsbW n=1 Tax=Capsulimonas corticalis TaxID=2219043 RepID=A0A402CZX8_9BACT|nr:ATP-binding protein [Capsulimonas corticalis]BDI33846.1 serine-protein kinase RsbW [Capsulimonas corticalis]